MTSREAADLVARTTRDSIPQDGFDCVYLYENGREVGCLNGPQNDPDVIARAKHWSGGAARPDAGYAVKALEWSQSPPPAHEHEPFVYWAAGVGGYYRAERNGMLWMAHDAFVWEQYPTQKAAKAAAQADYEQRIRSALSALPAPAGAAEEVTETELSGFITAQPWGWDAGTTIARALLSRFHITAKAKEGK